MSQTIPFTRLAYNDIKSQLILACGNDFVVIDPSTGHVIKGFLAAEIATKDYQELHRDVAFSHDGSLMATTGDDKLIHVYDTSDWSLKFSRPVVKRANAIQFSKNGSQIVVADKFGDVYIHPPEQGKEVKEKDKEEAPILGHVSMVTDMTLANDEKHIITADRDEHIRVSRYPNGYNIETFCLGHTDVVTCIGILPWATDVLISAGGDGTVRAWDYLQGKERQCFDLKPFVTNYKSEEEPIVIRLAVDSRSKTVAVAFAKMAAVVLLEWKDGLKHRATVEIDDPVLDVVFDSEGMMWTSLASSKERIVAFKLQEDKYERLPSDDARVQPVNQIQTITVDALPDLYPAFGLRKLLDLPEHVQAVAKRSNDKGKKRKTEA